MSVKIPDDILQSARMIDEEMRQEIAMLLYRKEKVTLERACRFAGMTIIQFQHLLAGARYSASL